MAAYDLTTLTALKSWLGTVSTNTVADTMLSSLITSTSYDFLRAVNRLDLFPAANYTQADLGDGNSRLLLRHWPITAVTSVTVAGATISAGSSTAPGFYIDTDLDPERVNQLYLNGFVFTDGQPFVVAYTAGYAAVPADVAQAVIEWCAERYKARPGTGLSSQRDAGGEHATYEKEVGAPLTTQAVISRYTRNWPSLDKRKDDNDYRITQIRRTFREKEEV